MFDNHMMSLLSRELELLEIQIKRLEKLNASYPAGEFVIRKKAKYDEYYLSDGKGGWEYVKKTDTAKVAPLSQKMFNSRLLESKLERKQKLEKALEIMKPKGQDAEDIFRLLPEEIRKYVDRDILTDHAAIGAWKKDGVNYEHPKRPDVTYTTKGGEEVRSKSEVIIADRLRAYGVPYFYEKPMENFMAWDVMFPDFTCLNKRTGKTYYWEHFGMMDEPAYCRAFLDRIQNYGAMGIFPGTELLMTFESKQAALRPTYVDELIENFLL